MQIEGEDYTNEAYRTQDIIAHEMYVHRLCVQCTDCGVVLPWFLMGYHIIEQCDDEKALKLYSDYNRVPGRDPTLREINNVKKNSLQKSELKNPKLKMMRVKKETLQEAY